jgi:HAMP domain-containing protein
MKFPRRRALLAALSVVAAVSTAAAWFWPSPPTRPCRETFERVRVGMTVTEVTAAVGGPPSRLVGFPAPWANNTPPAWVNNRPRESNYRVWIGSDSILEVHLADGRVERVVVTDRDAPTRWVRLRRQIGL